MSRGDDASLYAVMLTGAEHETDAHDHGDGHGYGSSREQHPAVSVKHRRASDGPDSGVHFLSLGLVLAIQLVDIA